MPFTLPITIRFQHCDPAGIVFYPRYVEMFNLVVEEWFEQVIGVGFNPLHYKMHLGVPTVRLESEFLAMSRLEDVIAFNLSVKRIGNSSLDLFIQGTCGDEKRCIAHLTLVCVELKSGQSVPWPGIIRSKFEPVSEENK